MTCPGIHSCQEPSLKVHPRIHSHKEPYHKAHPGILLLWAVLPSWHLQELSECFL